MQQPKLRFENFNMSWRPIIFNKLVSRVMRRNSKLQSTLPLTMSAQDGLIAQTNFFSKKVVGNRLRRNLLIYRGEFAYNKSYSKGYPYGVIKRLDKYPRGILSSLYLVFRPMSVNSQFLVAYFDSQKLNCQIREYAAEGARAHGLLNISPRNFFNMVLEVPSVSEQQKIGRFFNILDKLIHLQQDKLKLLRRLQTAYLQKIFPRKHERQPRIRFAGFCDNWKMKNITEIADIVGGGTPSTKKESYWRGNINWYSPDDISNSNSPYAYQSKRKITKLGLKNSSAHLHPANSTILLTTRATIGDMAILKTSAATNQGFQSLELHDGIDTYFIYSYQPVIKHKALRLSHGSTFKEVSKSDLKEMNLLIPSLSEQRRIGSFFSNLDHDIALQRAKLQHLRQLKRAYLQKMFC